MFSSVLVKLCSRCNLDCNYCYWFRDGSVRSLPARMGVPIQKALVDKIERHICRFALKEFLCSFHGGEPLLFGADRLRNLLEELDHVGARTGCTVSYALTTNGVLLTEQWINLIRDYQISVTCSIDGPREVHDRRRVTLRGAPTWSDAVNGYFALCRAGTAPSIIAVCDPESDPVETINHLVGDLGVRFCDVLMPDNNYVTSAPSIAEYYTKLFDHWYDKHFSSGVEVRILSDIVRGILGLESRTDSTGFGPLETVVVNTDGAIEPHDVLRIAGPAEVATGLNILVHEIADVEENGVWQAAKAASLDLHPRCQSCEFEIACGGGLLAQRWSPENAYNNPSVYCDDLYQIYSHVKQRLKNSIMVEN